MQQSRFSVLTGHLNDYPLADLVGILRHQQKTGRLLIEYSKSPAMFFFKDGELVDIQFERLTGLQALCVALAEAPASFNFNPLIKPTGRSIDRSLQKAVSELLGCWDDNAIEIQKVAPEIDEIAARHEATQPAFPLSVGRSPELPQAPNILALPPAPVQNRYATPVFATAAAGLLMLGISALMLVNGRLESRVLSASNSSVTPSSSGNTSAASAEVEPDRAEARGYSRPARERKQGERAVTPVPPATNPVSETAKNETDKEALAAADQGAGDVNKSEETADSTRSVKVILKIENGRVIQAAIGNHKPGMDAYEALALRIARQRRYPAKAASQETVMIKVTQPD